MSVYIVSWSGASPIGGLERVVYYQMQVLKEKYDVKLVTLEEVYTHRFFRIFSKLRNNPVVNAVFTSFYMLMIKKDSDIVITHGYNAPFVKADFLFLHGNWIGYEDAIGVPAYNIRRIMGVFENIAGHRAKKLVAVTEFVKKQWIEIYKLDERKIEVLNNCVDANVFKPMPKTYKEEINILFCGRLGHGKGLEKLVKLAEIIECEDGFHLTIATQSDWNVDLFKEFKNTTINIGVPINKLTEFYNSGDVFFFPSLYEGFGIVVIESLACGVPVIANDISAIRELCDNGMSGITLVKDEDMKNILSLIKKVTHEFSSDERKKKLHEEIEHTHGVDAYSKAMIDIFENN